MGTIEAHGVGMLTGKNTQNLPDGQNFERNTLRTVLDPALE